MMTPRRALREPVLNVGTTARPRLAGTLPFDDEGTPTGTHAHQGRILVGRLHSANGRGDGRAPTATGHAISFGTADRAYDEHVHRGRSGTFEDLIGDVKLGVYACGAFGGQTMLENFSFTAAYGRMIRTGGWRSW